MSESDYDSPTPTLTRVHSGASVRHVGGELYARGGSDETLSETIGSTKPQVLDELPKNESTHPTSETHSLIPSTSSTHDTGSGSLHGADPKWKRSTVLLLIIYTVIGTLFALGHHFLYETLSHHPTLAVSLQIGAIKIGPTWALTIGNGLSWLVQLFYTLAIGGALVQLFWHLLHTRHFTLREMDRVFSITSAFYTRTALRRATGLAGVAVISMGIGGVISTFAPPSLAISVFPLSQPCDIMTVDFTDALISPSSIALSNLVPQILITRSTLVPTSSSCSNCTYSVTYFAPALTCEEINMTSSPFHPDPVNHTVLWNVTIIANQVTMIWDIYLLSRTRVTGPHLFSDPQIIMCGLKNATYQVTVDHRNGTSVTAEMGIVPFRDTPHASSDGTYEVDTINAAYLSIAQAFGKFINGSMELTPIMATDSLLEITSGPGPDMGINQTITDPQLQLFNLLSDTFVAYIGWITCTDGINNYTRNIDLLTALPALMQHLSVSLLAGSVTDDNTSSSLSRVPDGRCLNESTVYVYHRVRLLAVYGSALLVTSVCVALGIHSVLIGQGSTLTFSNLVYAIMNPEMMEISNGQELPEDTVIHAVRGRFVPG